MKNTDKTEYIEYRIKKAEETLQAAIELSKGEFWNSCINRLYYSAFYAVSALLYNDNIITKTHNGIKTQFFQNYIKTEKITILYGELYSDLCDWRQKGDYGDFFDLTKEEVLPLIEPVQEFIDIIKGIIDGN